LNGFSRRVHYSKEARLQALKTHNTKTMSVGLICNVCGWLPVSSLIAQFGRHFNSLKMGRISGI
jgi:formate dehydrogenase maturation protein FdhE